MMEENKVNSNVELIMELHKKLQAEKIPHSFEELSNYSDCFIEYPAEYDPSIGIFCEAYENEDHPYDGMVYFRDMMDDPTYSKEGSRVSIDYVFDLIKERHLCRRCQKCGNTLTPLDKYLKVVVDDKKASTIVIPGFKCYTCDKFYFSSSIDDKILEEAISLLE